MLFRVSRCPRCAHSRRRRKALKTAILKTAALKTALGLVAAFALSAAAAAAQENRELNQGGIVPWTDAAFAKIQPIIDARYRFEFVDQDGFDRNAAANTLRTRFGFEGDDLGDFAFELEAENVLHIGPDRFNDTVNGRNAFPNVNDPEAFELNLANITYSGLPDTEIRIGRQMIELNNERFVSDSPWRQNERTFDAFRIENRSIRNTTISYMYLDRVHGPLGDRNPTGEFESDSHIFTADFELDQYGELNTYALLFDFSNADAFSSASIGARWENSVTVTDYFVADLFAEYAYQSDHGDNPADYGLSYMHFGAGTAYGPIRGAVAYERLGGDGVDAVQFPVGMRHGRNGFADAFVITPASGVGDLYLEVEAGWPRPPIGGRRLSALVQLHRYSAVEGSGKLGDELDAWVRWAYSRRILAELRMAFFDGTAAGPADRNKVMFSLQYRY